jgi:hypothetical protein
VAQEPLFYSFSLERHVPADHLLRSIDGTVRISVCGRRLNISRPWPLRA